MILAFIKMLLAWYGMVWYGMVWYGIAWHGMLCYYGMELWNLDIV